MDLYSLLLTLGLANVLIAFLSATVSRSWIPWLIALLWKKPISRKFMAGLSVFSPCPALGLCMRPCWMTDFQKATPPSWASPPVPPYSAPVTSSAWPSCADAICWPVKFD